MNPELNSGALHSPRQVLPLESRASDAVYVLKDATFVLELPNKFSFTPAGDSDSIDVRVIPVSRKGDHSKYDIDIVIFDKKYKNARIAYNLEDLPVEAVQVVSTDTPLIEARLVDSWRQRLGPFRPNATYIFCFPNGGNIEAPHDPQFPPDLRVPKDFRRERPTVKITSEQDGDGVQELELIAV